MTDQMDTLLRDAGERWRRDPGPMPALDDMLPASPTRRRRTVLPIAAAVVVVAVAVAVAVTRTPQSSGPAAPGPTTAAPSSLCQDAFTAQASFGRKPPYLIIRLRLTNSGSTSCAISSYGPHIDVVDSAGDVLARGADATAVKRTPDQLIVPRGKTADLSVVWASMCPAGTDPAALMLHLDGDRDSGTSGIRIGLGDHPAPPCQPGSQVAFQYDYPTLEQPSPTDPCAGLALSVNVGSHVEPVPLRRETHLNAAAPARVTVRASGPCSGRVSADVYPAGGGDSLDGSGHSWTLTRPGQFVLTFGMPACPPHDARCLGGIVALATVKITVS